VTHQFRPVPKPAPKPPREKKRVTRKPIRSGPPKARDRAYLDWVKTQPCVAWEPGTTRGNFCRSIRPNRLGNEPAHVKTKGSGGADRGNTVPLCPLHHDEQEGDTEGFESVYGISLKLEAARLLVRYIEEGEPGEQARRAP
jgi:hypothetical protein